jgi:hypothetical protein
VASKKRIDVAKHVSDHWGIPKEQAKDMLRAGWVVDTDNGEIVTSLTTTRPVGTLVQRREVHPDVHDG